MRSMILFVANLILGSVAVADTPTQMSVENLAVNGSGCPVGSVSSSVSPDKQSVTIYFSDYISEIGPGIDAVYRRRACQLTFNIKHSPGWRFGLVAFRYQGIIDLDEGIVARHRSQYYLQGDPEEFGFVTTMQGPERGTFSFSEQIAPTEVYWSDCDSNRAINIKTSLRLNATDQASPEASGYIGTDSLDAQLGSQEWRLVWESCSER